MGTWFSQQITGKFRIRWKSCRGEAALGEGSHSSLNLDGEGAGSPLVSTQQQVLRSLASGIPPSLFLFCTLSLVPMFTQEVCQGLCRHNESLSAQKQNLRRNAQILQNSQPSGKPTAPTVSPGG